MFKVSPAVQNPFTAGSLPSELGTGSLKTHLLAAFTPLWGALSLTASLTCAGCGDDTPQLGTSEVEQRLKLIALLYGAYSGDHMGSPPQSEKALKDWAVSLPEARRQSYGVEDVQSIWTSPRDNEPIVVRFGQQSGPPGVGIVKPGESITVGPGSGYEAKETVIAHEKTGVDGERYVVYGAGRTALLNEDEFTKATQ
jgi:hypothetical protein